MSEHGVAVPAYFGKLNRGDKGPDVAMVQTWLNGVAHKWPAMKKVTVDGAFGADTEREVKLFQLVSGLKEDGVVGEKTWNALGAAYGAEHDSGECYPGISMRMGDHGACVKSVQTALKEAVPSLVADGHFGAKTRAAVMTYQGIMGLTMDGVVGEDTWKCMKDL